MGLTERHWFENEDVPENYEWALEDAVYNSCVKPSQIGKVGEVGMTLESAKEMDRRCVLVWLMQIVRDPAVAFNTYSYRQQVEFAHDAIVLLQSQKEVESTINEVRKEDKMENMIDRGKVIKGLECIKNAEMRCGNPCEETGNCEYATLIRDPSGESYYPYICNRKKLCEDAIVLMKEQEAVKPIELNMYSIKQYACGFCGHEPVGNRVYHAKYCSECGKAVKWDD